MDLIPAGDAYGPNPLFLEHNKFRSLKLISNVDMEQPLGPEPFGVDYGRLDNGLSYYVRTNSEPKMRAALALSVKAGSVLEEEHERGVAPMLGYLAQFANFDIIEFLQSVGAEIQGAASTDDTVHELLVPVDNPDLLSQAISVLAEFSTEIRVAAEDFEKLRGSIMKEYRDTRDATERMQEERHWALMMAGSKYERRMPNGTEKAAQTVSAETVMQFYSKWYNLRNMALIAVGDFPDTQCVVELIKSHFGKRSSPLDLPLLPKFEVPSHEDPRIALSLLDESELGGSAVIIRCLMPAGEPTTVKEYRDSIVESLFLRALNQRLLKICRRKDPPFFSCSAESDDLVRAIKAYTVTSFCKEKGTIEALESLLTELARIRLHGFTEREISIVKASLMSEIESAYLERDQIQSTGLRDDYIQHFLANKPVVGIEYEARLRKTLVPSISSSEVSKYAEKFRTSCNCLISAIESPQATLTIDDLKNVVTKMASLEDARNIAAWDEERIPEEIVLHTKPNPGSIIQQFEHPHFGVTKLILSNGMEICYKCTDFLTDQIVFTGFSNGGLYELSESEFFPSAMGVIIAHEIGVFGYKPSVLKDMLVGKRVEVEPNVGARMRTFTGDCSPTDLETALHLVYQLFTTNVAPTEEQVRVFKQMTEEGIGAHEKNPYITFGERVMEFNNYAHSYFFRPFPIDEVRKVDSTTKTCEYFNDCFKDPSTFTVVFVGNIDPAVACPLILHYLGGIPKPCNHVLQFGPDVLKSTPTFKFPEKIIREVVYIPMVEAQCFVTLTVPVELKKGAMIEEIHFVGFMSKLLETKILRLLRFKHEQICLESVSVFLGGGNPLFIGNDRVDISIKFQCDPSISSTLVEVALDEIVRLQEEGPTDQDLSTILEIEQRAHENGLEDNYCLLEWILESYQDTSDLAATFETMKGVEDARVKVRQILTPETARSALRRVLPYPCRTKYTLLILMPPTYRHHCKL